MAKLERRYRLGKRFDDALLHALRLHRKQQRKGNNVPYAAHLLGTAGLVLDFGGDEAQAMAALLHDAAEDHGGRPRLAKIRKRFGADVARMVEDCTDTFEKEKPEWRPRKEAYIASLPGKRARSLLADVAAGDDADLAEVAAEALEELEWMHGERDLPLFVFDPHADEEDE